MPNEKQTPKELKVTDKRIFTADGDIREEFQNEIKPAEPQATQKAAPEAPKPEADAPPPQQERRQQPQQTRPPAEERRKSIADKATNPGTDFSNFIEPLIAQGYMSLGMLRNPYQPQAKVDTAAARQMIDILTMLKDKTAGNLTPDEDDFLDTHLGELKLAFVQRTKTI